MEAGDKKAETQNRNSTEIIIVAEGVDRPSVSALPLSYLGIVCLSVGSSVSSCLSVFL